MRFGFWSIAADCDFIKTAALCIITLCLVNAFSLVDGFLPENRKLSLLVSSAAARCVHLSNATFERSPARYNETIGPKQKKCFTTAGVCFCFPGSVEELRLGGTVKCAPLLSQQDRRLNNVAFSGGGGIQTRQLYCVQVPDNSPPHHRKEGKDQCRNNSVHSGGRCVHF